jgi:flavodoxin
MKSLIVVFSYHHHNTEKIANAFARVLDAQIVTPQKLDLSEIQKYDLVGFGSGIYDDKHHVSLLELVDKLPKGNGKKTFIFSTSGVPVAILGNKFLKDYMRKAHSSLKNKLEYNGYKVVDDFICPGFNTNVFLKYFGGLNKSRPNAEDLKQAENFANKLRNI